MKNFLLQIKNYFLKIKEIYLKITLFYFFLSTLVHLIQFRGLEYMNFFLSQAIERPLPADLTNIFMRGISNPPEQFEFIYKLNMYLLKTLMDTQICMFVCMAIATFSILKFFTNKYISRFFKFKIDIGNIALIKFSAMWVVIYFIANTLLLILNLPNKIYNFSTLIVEIAILVIMAKDESFGFKIIKDSEQSSLPA